MLLQTPRDGRLTGFGLKNGVVYRFVENEHGSSELDMIASGENNEYFAFRDRATFSHVMGLSKANDAEPQQYLVMAVRPASSLPAGQSPIPGGRLVQRTLGDLAPFDKDLLILQLRQEDRPCAFTFRLERCRRGEDTARLLSRLVGNRVHVPAWIDPLALAIHEHLRDAPGKRRALAVFGQLINII